MGDKLFQYMEPLLNYLGEVIKIMELNTELQTLYVLGLGGVATIFLIYLYFRKERKQTDHYIESA